MVACAFCYSDGAAPVLIRRDTDDHANSQVDYKWRLNIRKIKMQQNKKWYKTKGTKTTEFSPLCVCVCVCLQVEEREKTG